MELDDDLCLCFHVTKRKVVNFIRIEKPVRPAQLSECFGAGTGCGWCRPYLRKLLEQQSQTEQSIESDLPSAAEYAQSREQYVAEGKGKPPGQQTRD